MKYMMIELLTSKDSNKIFVFSPNKKEEISDEESSLKKAKEIIGHFKLLGWILVSEETLLDTKDINHYVWILSKENI